MLIGHMKVIAQPKALIYRGTGAWCFLCTLTKIAPVVLGLLMAVILLLTAPAAMAQPAYVEGEVIVGFRSTADDIQIATFESRNGLTKLKSFPNIRAVHYRIAPVQTTDEAITILSKEPIVEYAEPNWILKHQQSLPTDPKFPEQWYLRNTGQVVNGLDGTPGIDINWLAANNLFSGTQDIVVAVVDTGVAFDHPEFLGKLWVNPQETIDGIDNDGNGYVDDLIGWDFYDNDALPLDERSHGTLVASLIASISGNGEGGVGVSSRVKLMPLRAGNDLGTFHTAAIISAFTYAGNKGAKIINASFGGSSYSSSQYATIQWLGSKGVLVVAAAGNGGSDGRGDNNDISPQYPASYPLDNIISVAAVDQQGRLATFSNYGPSSVHIAAPGKNIFGASLTFSPVFYDSFETGGTGWTQGHLPGSLSPYIWSIYVDGFGRHWLTDSINFWGYPTNYTGNTNSFAQTPLISVGFAQLLSYRIWHQLEYSYDWLIVEASSDGGATWMEIDDVTDYSYSSCPDCSVYAGSIRNVDLSFFGLQNKNFYIRFRLVSDGSINYDGVYLREITVKEVDTFSYDGTQYKYGDGTSFAAPLVAGVAALIWSQRPDFTYKQVRNIILNSAKSLPALQGKISTGGMVDAYASLQSAIAARPYNVFPDVLTNYWAYDYIMAIYNVGITIGCAQDDPNTPENERRYCPEDYVTREQMAAFIVRAVEGEPPANYCESGTPFPDVSSDMWSCKYIKRLKELRITTGYGNGTYGPYDFVPREQMAAFIVRAVEGEPPLTYCDSGSLFTDVTPDMWSCIYIKRLKELEITTGYGDGRYGPYDFVTRAQMAAFLSRAFLGME